MKSAYELIGSGREAHKVPQRVWEYFDTEVVPVIRDQRVARKVFETRPLRSRAVKKVIWDEKQRRGRAMVDMSGEGWARDDVVREEKSLTVPMLHAELSLNHRDLDENGDPAAETVFDDIDEAAQEVQDGEEELVISGDDAILIDGLRDLTAAPVNSVSEGTWDTAGNFWKAMQAMEAELNTDGIPMRGVHLFAHPTNIKEARGQRASVKEDPLNDALESGFLAGHTGYGKMAEGTAFAVVPLPAYMRLLVGQELTISRLPDEKFNQVYSVWEILVPQWKRKEAIVKFTC